MPRTALAIVAVLTLLPSVAAAEIIDRVLAVVNNQIITLSDARAALRFGLVRAPAPDADPIAAALEGLIERQLMLGEVERYAPPEPSDAAIDEEIAAIRSNSKDALEFEIVLNRYGLSQEELRRIIRDRLRVEAYLQQRFATTAEPSESELIAYYKEHQGEFTVDGRALPFDEVRDRVNARLVEARRQAFIRDWLEGVRRRANIVTLYSPGRS